jgi:hypothetical protein
MLTGCSMPRSKGGTTGAANATSSLAIASSLFALACSLDILATTGLGESHTTTLLLDLRLTGLSTSNPHVHAHMIARLHSLEKRLGILIQENTDLTNSVKMARLYCKIFMLTWYRLP